MYIADFEDNRTSGAPIRRPLYYGTNGVEPQFWTNTVVPGDRRSSPEARTVDSYRRKNWQENHSRKYAVGPIHSTYTP